MKRGYLTYTLQKKKLDHQAGGSRGPRRQAWVGGDLSRVRRTFTPQFKKDAVALVADGT